MKLPPFARQFAFDAIKGALMAVTALNLVIPSTLTEAKGVALIVGTAVIRAIFGAAGLAIPAFLAYLQEGFGLEDEALFDVSDDELDDDLTPEDDYPNYPQAAKEADLMADRRDLTNLSHF